MKGRLWRGISNVVNFDARRLSAGIMVGPNDPSTLACILDKRASMSTE